MPKQCSGDFKYEFEHYFNVHVPEVVIPPLVLWPTDSVDVLDASSGNKNVKLRAVEIR